MKSLRSSSPQSNCVTTSSAPSRRSWVFSKSIGSEGAIDAFLAHEFIVTHDSCHALLRKRLGMQHTHLKLPCFLPKENGRFFYWFCHVPPRFRSRVQHPLQKTRVSYQKSAPKVKRSRELTPPSRPAFLRQRGHQAALHATSIPRHTSRGKEPTGANSEPTGSDLIATVVFPCHSGPSDLTLFTTHVLNFVSIGWPAVPREVKGRTAKVSVLPEGNSDLGISSVVTPPFGSWPIPMLHPAA